MAVNPSRKALIASLVCGAIVGISVWSLLQLAVRQSIAIPIGLLFAACTVATVWKWLLELLAARKISNTPGDYPPPN